MSLLNVSRVFIRYRIEPSDVVRRMYVPVVVCWLCQSKSSDLLGCDLRAGRSTNHIAGVWVTALRVYRSRSKPPNGEDNLLLATIDLSSYAP